MKCDVTILGVRMLKKDNYIKKVKIMKINQSFVLRKICNVFLLIPVKRNDITQDAISLNYTAAMIFQECKNALSSYELAKIVSGKFEDISEEEIMEELKFYIDSLIEQGLIIMEVE